MKKKMFWVPFYRFAPPRVDHNERYIISFYRFCRLGYNMQQSYDKRSRWSLTSSKVLTILYLLFEVLPSSNEETNKSNIPPWQINTARDSCKQGLNYTFRQTGRSKYSLRCKTPISKSLHDLFRHPPKEPVFRMINSVTLTILFDITWVRARTMLFCLFAILLKMYLFSSPHQCNAPPIQIEPSKRPKKRRSLYMWWWQTEQGPIYLSQCPYTPLS